MSPSKLDWWCILLPSLGEVGSGPITGRSVLGVGGSGSGRLYHGRSSLGSDRSGLEADESGLGATVSGGGGLHHGGTCGGGTCGGGGGTRTTVEGSNGSMWLAVRFGVERLDLVQSTMEWM